MFSEAVFGARLARALDALLAMQRADAAQMAAIFTTPTGPSLFEADSLTLHYFCGGVSLAALVAHHPVALPHVAEALDGLDIAGVRARRWEARAFGAALRSRAAARRGRPWIPRWRRRRSARGALRRAPEPPRRRRGHARAH